LTIQIEDCPENARHDNGCQVNCCKNEIQGLHGKSFGLIPVMGAIWSAVRNHRFAFFLEKEMQSGDASLLCLFFGKRNAKR
jgi:hypothetical protein